MNCSNEDQFPELFLEASMILPVLLHLWQWIPRLLKYQIPSTRCPIGGEFPELPGLWFSLHQSRPGAVTTKPGNSEHRLGVLRFQLFQQPARRLQIQPGPGNICPDPNKARRGQGGFGQYPGHFRFLWTVSMLRDNSPGLCRFPRGWIECYQWKSGLRPCGVCWACFWQWSVLFPQEPGLARLHPRWQQECRRRCGSCHSDRPGHLILHTTQPIVWFLFWLRMDCGFLIGRVPNPAKFQLPWLGFRPPQNCCRPTQNNFQPSHGGPVEPLLLPGKL